jgi:hypothetical protein
VLAGVFTLSLSRGTESWIARQLTTPSNPLRPSNNNEKLFWCRRDGDPDVALLIPQHWNPNFFLLRPLLTIWRGPKNDNNQVQTIFGTYLNMQSMHQRKILWLLLQLLVIHYFIILMIMSLHSLHYWHTDTTFITRFYLQREGRPTRLHVHTLRQRLEGIIIACAKY